VAVQVIALRTLRPITSQPVRNAMSSTLYHLVPVSNWEHCKSAQQAYFPPTYQQVTVPPT
jgi:hypothetical protein